MAEEPQKQNPFEMTTEELDQKFDIVINEFKQRAVLAETRFMFGALKTVKKSEILPRMIGYGLLSQHNELGTVDSYQLTGYGYEVLRAGGWIQYNRNKTDHDKLMREQIKSTIDTNKFQKTVLFSTIALSLATFFLSLGTFFSNERLLDIERKRFEHEQTQPVPPAVNPHVKVTLLRDTIVLVQPIKMK